MSRGNRSRQPAQRTVEERERAREQRALRRAQREGDAPEDAEPAGAPAIEPQPASMAEPQVEPAPPVEPEPPVTHEPPVEHEPQAAHPAEFEDPTEEVPARPADDTSAWAGPAQLDTPESAPAAPAQLDIPDSVPAAPAPPPAAGPGAGPVADARSGGPGWGSGGRGWGDAQLVGGPQPAPPQPPPPPGRRWGGGRRRAWLARGLAVLALIVVVVLAIVLVDSRSGSGHTATVSAPNVIKVLIPEGETRVQISQLAKRAGLTGSYRGASRSSPLLNPASYGAPHRTPDLEGFLFPATYDMYAGAPVSRLVEEQLIAFHQNFGVTEISRAHELHITPYELLIVASMVEREAQVLGDRAKIAGVIYNRLRKRMPLGVDATLYYAIELRTGVPTYTHELTQAQLHIDSPYNTRTHTGLPPTPIANPGAASIHAAAYPARVPYLYYVLAPDGCGEHVFSTTAAEFELHAAAYREALAKNHGHPPACAKK